MSEAPKRPANSGPEEEAGVVTAGEHPLPASAAREARSAPSAETTERDVAQAPAGLGPAGLGPADLGPGDLGPADLATALPRAWTPQSPAAFACGC